MNEIEEKAEVLQAMLPNRCNHSCMLPHENGSEECASCGIVRLSREMVEDIRLGHLMGDSDDALRNEL